MPPRPDDQGSEAAVSPTGVISAQAALELLCGCGNTQRAPVPRVRVVLGEDWMPALADLVALARLAGWYVADDLTDASCPSCLRTVGCLTWRPDAGRLVTDHRFGPAVPALPTTPGNVGRSVRVCEGCGWRDYDPPLPPPDRSLVVGAVRLVQGTDMLGGRGAAVALRTVPAIPEIRQGLGRTAFGTATGGIPSA
ncbi:hypothetical protein [Streptoalloteichus tenebrarius]|nr:hypothetical protein [Streptoalloteichus tenebrarius]